MANEKYYYKTKCNADIGIEPALNPDGTTYWRLINPCEDSGVPPGYNLNEVLIRCITCRKVAAGPVSQGIYTTPVRVEMPAAPKLPAQIVQNLPQATPVQTDATTINVLPKISVAAPAPAAPAAPTPSAPPAMPPFNFGAFTPAAAQGPAQQLPPPFVFNTSAMPPAAQINPVNPVKPIDVKPPEPKAGSISNMFTGTSPVSPAPITTITEAVPSPTPASAPAPAPAPIAAAPIQTPSVKPAIDVSGILGLKLPLPGIKDEGPKCATTIPIPAQITPTTEATQPLAASAAPVAPAPAPLTSPLSLDLSALMPQSDTPRVLEAPPIADKMIEFNLLKVVEDAITPEDKLDVDEILCANIPELAGGPSSGGFSWHTLENAMKCWRRAYYALVVGLVPKKPGRQLQWGTLYHACWELWFKTGGRKSWDLPCQIIRDAGGVSLAAEVAMTVKKELEIYARTEAEEWDIRAVEANAVCFIESQRINGKSISVPISCRHDLIYAKRLPGTSCAPLGPVPHGVYILDRKTATAATRDLIYGYAMDGQFLTNAVVYKRSDEEERFGPLLGVQVAAAIKHKTPSEKSYFRVEATINLDDAVDFYKDELVPYATELYRRLSDPAVRGDRSCWAKNHSQCSGKYMCPYFDLCANGEDSMFADIYFKVSERRKFNLDSLALPPKGTVKAEPKEADPEKEAKKARKTELTNLATATLVAICSNMPQCAKNCYLTPGHTETSVKSQLTVVLGALWPVQHAWLTELQGLAFRYTVKGDGIAWSVSEEKKGPEAAPAKGRPKTKLETHRGALSWKGLASAICKDWWDLSKNPPLGE